ncbi:hypothetical protein Geu3261_0208_003 [Komagataeibacter europaeus NBRC 3261]|uniref:Uncharacterized protein n=1 Tax=Komagataeibacter europaeus NBRC 3261 TaxID=1234669 RepID=A0A0D6Q3L6_KOMEU|nr:hypothetical protein [Komagataeibacter europaeus]GAN97570.1 hypothetical protein Geu3261_0208_003 [Komagataeibacter europaeus NBRC 3261]
MARWYPPRIRRTRTVAHDNASRGLPCPAWQMQPPIQPDKRSVMIVAGCALVRLHGNGVIEIRGDLTIEGKN